MYVLVMLGLLTTIEKRREAATNAREHMRLAIRKLELWGIKCAYCWSDKGLDRSTVNYKLDVTTHSGIRLNNEALVTVNSIYEILVDRELFDLGVAMKEPGVSDDR
ncbi:hypothetical protein TruAng_002831 [Truncatella angustata]|nr:hypothetical protein TruAng_002831 [Truncatella angustata]